MIPVIMIRLHHYAYGPCAYCQWNTIVRCSVVSQKWICQACIVAQPYYPQLAPETKRAMNEEYNEATIQLGKRGLLPVADVPLERMVAPCDLEWWKELA